MEQHQRWFSLPCRMVSERRHMALTPKLWGQNGFPLPFFMFLLPSDTSPKGQRSCKTSWKKILRGMETQIWAVFQDWWKPWNYKKRWTSNPLIRIQHIMMCKSLQTGDCLIARRIKGMREAWIPFVEHTDWECRTIAPGSAQRACSHTIQT